MLNKITAIVPASNRLVQTLNTLARLHAMQPDEIIVHVDGSNAELTQAIAKNFPAIRVLTSEENIGPGGGRNKLVAASRNEIIASFDDDSYPLDADYFDRAIEALALRPDASIITTEIFHIGEPIIEATKHSLLPATSFVSCGVVFRRSTFLKAGGFVPLVVAYSMEEEDLTLRVIEQSGVILASKWLRVFHNTDRSHHSHPAITAGVIKNLALLAFLRYPKRYWPYAVLQIVNRIAWCLRVGRRAGIASGIFGIPGHLWNHRSHRRLVSVETMRQRRVSQHYAAP